MRTASPTDAIWSWAATAVRTAASMDVNPAAMPSPIVAKIWPPVASTAARRTAKWASTRSDIPADCSHWRVEPTMSVNSRVSVARGAALTVPAGRLGARRPTGRVVSCSRRIVSGGSAGSRCPAPVDTS